MTPVLSPAHGVVLPLPPPETGEESEEENTSVWSGFGKIVIVVPHHYSDTASAVPLLLY